MSSILHIDIETYSEANLKQSGVYRYAEHASTEILTVCYAFDDEPVCTWVPIAALPPEICQVMIAYHQEHGGEFIVGLQVPFELHEHIVNGGECRAHHAQFEEVLLNGAPGARINFPITQPEQWVCTAAKVAAHALPRSLENATNALKVEHTKSLEGRITMLQLCKPRKPSKHNLDTRWTPQNAPEKYIILYQYCAGDVRSERDLDNIVPDLPAYEQRVWLLDQKINHRGVMIDEKGVTDVVYLRDEYKNRLRRKCREICGFNPSQTAKVAEWIREQGFPIDNLQAPTIDEILKEGKAPEDIHAVLRIRRLHEMKAPAKYDAMQRAVCEDGRIRGMFMYHGAQPGRWSGMIVQLQNLYRGDIKDPNNAVEIYKQRDLDWLNCLYGTNPMKLFASTVRTMLIAPPGKKLLCMDFKSIEGRCMAWVAGDEAKLELFRTHGLVYQNTAAQIFGMDTDLETLKTIKKEYPHRYFLGKIGELACGYQGAHNAYMGMSEKYGVEIKPEVAEKIVDDWRRLNHKIVKLWYKLENAAKAAIGNPGKVYSVNGKIKFKVENDFLYMRLPSGRFLAYYQPMLDIHGQITYMGVHTLTRQWCRIDTWGGRLSQNMAEGICRDLLVNGMFHLEKAGCDIIAHVHDEIISEIETDQITLDDAEKIMCRLPTWAKGFPVQAEGFIAQRYRKDG